jgi:O-antigen ligase
VRFLRIGICSLIAIGVLAHGGVEDWARAIFETGAAVLFLVWAIGVYLGKDETAEISPLLPPLAGLLLVALVQIVFRRTASMYDTQQEFALLLADVLVVFVAVQAYRTLEQWRGFVWFLMIFGFLVSIFGVLQHLTFNGKLYWFRTMHYGGIPFGPYVNRNHFAGFAELFIPLALVPLMLGKVRRERRFIVGVFAVVSVGSLFLAASRGGIISFVVQVAIIVVWMSVRRTGKKQVLAGAAVLAAALLMVSLLGVKEIAQRFTTMKSLEVATGKRASMRLGTWRIFMDHPWTGTGLGTLEVVYPPYETDYDGRIVNHAHNDYLEALSDTGIAGGLCCALFLGMLLFHSLRELSESEASLGAVLNLSGLVACAGFLAHSVVDFNLHLPTNALLFLLLATLATSTIRPEKTVRSEGSRRGHHKVKR